MATSTLTAVRQLSLLLSLRTLPYAASLLVGTAPKKGTRLPVPALFLAAAATTVGLGEQRSLLLIIAGYIYYLVATSAARSLIRLLSCDRISRSALLLLSFFFLVLLPGVVLHSNTTYLVLVVGCELTLKFYSYCVEVARYGAKHPILARDRVLFFFVNPTLLYTQRGARLPSPSGGSGLIRTAFGIAVLFLDFAVLSPYSGRLAIAANLRHALIIEYSTLVLLGLARFTSIYAAHSGLASIDIGLMAACGWSVPERYRLPWLSSGPLDFWRRWNTYVRVWLEAYVFLPLARRIARRAKHRGGTMAAALATLWTSAGIHAAYAFTVRQRIADTLPQLKFFVAGGLFCLGWYVVAAIAPVLVAATPQAWAGRLSWLGRVAGRAIFVTALVTAAITWG